jgi:uncharacterized protein YbjQ (UPF0145 family)
VIDYEWTTTAFDLPGCRIARNLGVVRGVTVRSAHLGSQMVAGLRSLAGGRIDEYVKMCEQARAEAFSIMVAHADELGANAIVGARYDATELAQNMTEVIAYGTAVVVEADAPRV